MKRNSEGRLGHVVSFPARAGAVFSAMYHYLTANLAVSKFSLQFFFTFLPPSLPPSLPLQVFFLHESTLKQVHAPHQLQCQQKERWLCSQLRRDAVPGTQMVRNRLCLCVNDEWCSFGLHAGVSWHCGGTCATKWVSTLGKSGSQSRSSLSRPSSGVHGVSCWCYCCCCWCYCCCCWLEGIPGRYYCLFSAALSHTLPPWLRHVSETGICLLGKHSYQLVGRLGFDVYMQY